MHVAPSRGAAHARLQLHPAELGGIDVQLQVTAEGLTATITAERPEAVPALQQAGAELRRALEDRGIDRRSLDVELAPGAGRRRRHERAASAAPRSAPPRGTTDRRHGRRGRRRPAPTPPTTTTTPTAGLPAGALVDVLA